MSLRLDGRELGGLPVRFGTEDVGLRIWCDGRLELSDGVGASTRMRAQAWSVIRGDEDAIVLRPDRPRQLTSNEQSTGNAPACGDADAVRVSGVTRSARPRGRDAHAKPVDTVLDLLRREARPLDVAAIKRRLAALGVKDVEATWAAVGPVLRKHAEVSYAGKKYGLVEPAEQEVTAAQALAQLAGDLAEPHRSALVALVQAELEAMREQAAEADASAPASLGGGRAEGARLRSGLTARTPPRLGA